MNICLTTYSDISSTTYSSIFLTTQSSIFLTIYYNIFSITSDQSPRPYQNMSGFNGYANARFTFGHVSAGLVQQATTEGNSSGHNGTIDPALLTLSNGDETEADFAHTAMNIRHGQEMTGQGPVVEACVTSDAVGPALRATPHGVDWDEEAFIQALIQALSHQREEPTIDQSSLPETHQAMTGPAAQSGTRSEPIDLTLPHTPPQPAQSDSGYGSSPDAVLVIQQRLSQDSLPPIPAFNGKGLKEVKPSKASKDVHKTRSERLARARKDESAVKMANKPVKPKQTNKKGMVAGHRQANYHQRCLGCNGTPKDVQVHGSQPCPWCPANVRG